MVIYSTHFDIGFITSEAKLQHQSVLISKQMIENKEETPHAFPWNRGILDMSMEREWLSHKQR